MTDSLDPSVFRSTVDFYIAEFEYILVGITSCYKMMIGNGDTVPNHEEKIRNILYTRYLNNNEVRNRIGLNYNIDCEPAEYTNGELTGYIDLKIYSRNSLTDTSAYYIIECKRLDNQNLTGTTGLNAEYIKNGIMRFVAGQYSTNKYLNGMIGFIVDRVDIKSNIGNINKLLKEKFLDTNTVTHLTLANFIKDFKYQYYSTHKDIGNKEITLYHLMFDYSKNIKV